MGAELAPLKLERARFIVEIASDSEPRRGRRHRSRGVFVQTNPGSRAGPLMKVASGGELARFMLALKVALADRGSAPTLVFDEIDTGVGGAVADAIGQRLARLASAPRCWRSPTRRRSPRARPAISGSPRATWEGRTRRDPGAGAGSAGAARGNCADARRRDHHRGSARRRQTADRECGLAAAGAPNADGGFPGIARGRANSRSGLARLSGGPIKRRADAASGGRDDVDSGREVGEKRRRDRLAAALRENLKRRKAQQRGRTPEAEPAISRPPDASPSPGDRQG